MIRKFFGFVGDWKENKIVVKWLMKIGKNFKRYIFGFLIINFVTMVISLGSAIAGRYVVDAATGFKSDLFFNYIVIMLVTTVASIIISSLSSMFSGYVNEKFAFGVRLQMYDKVQRSVWNKLTKYHSADVLTRLSVDVDTVASSIISIVPNAIVTFLQLILVLCILIKYDPVLAIIGLIVGPLGFFAAIFFRKRYALYNKRIKQSTSEYYAFMQESLANTSVVKTFQLEDENNHRFGQIRDKRLKLVMKSSRLQSVMTAVMRLIYAVGYVVTFSWCAYNLTKGDGGYTYGTMTLFLALVSQVQGSIKNLGGIIPQCYSLIISAKRIREITEIENEEYANVEAMPKTVGVRVQDVTFSYDEGETVLDSLSFEIPANCRVGIVGASGAGKTTFIRLLLSLVKANSGNIEYIDENGCSESACVASRRFISYVPQGNTLMSGSVRENLLSGDPNATDEQMWMAIEDADAAEFLKKNPKGLDAVLTEDAGGLSEGQAQRIAIARAFLRNRPVLILDEATSALDESAETRIFERLSATNDKTCFIITHRRSMLKYCDIILEIDENGKGTITK